MNEFDLRKFLYDNPLMEKKEDSKKGNKEEQKRMEGSIRDNEIHIDKLNKDIKADRKKLSKLKKDEPKDVNEAEVTETAKLTKEGLKSMIREKITSILAEDSIDEAEDVEVEDDENVDVDVEKDVNVDVEDEVDIDDESVESDIEVKTEIPGEDADTAAILGLLTKAQDEAVGIGDEVLMDQIGNTITYFTRKHVVKASA
jgi:hypothetical protein